jgi:hypothetical protein
MRTLGIVGGIAPESTIEYYRLLMASYRERVPDGSAPSIVIDSIDLKKVLDLTAAGDLAGLTGYLVGEVRLLARAGAVWPSSPPTRRTSSSTRCSVSRRSPSSASWKRRAPPRKPSG